MLSTEALENDCIAQLLTIAKNHARASLDYGMSGWLDSIEKPYVEPYQVTLDEILMLRDKSGAGLMDCKKALIAVNGDMEEAACVLRDLDGGYASISLRDGGSKA
jgi:hypothetical protein